MNRFRVAAFLVLLLVVGSLVACGTSSTSGGSLSIVPGGGGNSTIPTGTTFIVVLENSDYSNVVGSASMPYLNGLISNGGLATQFYANTHPSIGNYFMLTTGQIVTNDDTFNGTVTVDNIVRQMKTAGKSWKVYAESIPSTGYLGGDVSPYVKRHNPFAYFSDVVSDAAQAQNIVPFSQLATDLAAGRVPDLAFIVPNIYNDAHDCPPGTVTCTPAIALGTADTWMRNNLGQITSNAQFQASGLLVVTFDEAGTDNANGGGKIATVLYGPAVKAGFRSTTMYQLQSLLKLMMSRAGMSSFPGAAATATGMEEFFK